MDSCDVKCVPSKTSTAPVRVVRWGLTMMIPLAASFVSCDRMKQTGEQMSEQVKQVGEEVKQAGERLWAVNGDEARKVAEARSKEEAVKKYPALGVLDSPFNKSFRERFYVLKRTQPSFFERSDWPQRLAEEIAVTVGRGDMRAEASGAADDWVLQANEIREYSERLVGQHRTVQGVILKIHEVDVAAKMIRFRLVGDLEIQMPCSEFPAIRDVGEEFLEGRLRVEGGRLFVKGLEGSRKGGTVYFPKDTTLLSEGSSVQLRGNVVVRGNVVTVEKAQLRSMGGGI